jgi:hypothetical protein
MVIENATPLALALLEIGDLAALLVADRCAKAAGVRFWASKIAPCSIKLVGRRPRCGRAKLASRPGEWVPRPNWS